MTNSNYKPIPYLLMFNMFIIMGGIGMIVPVMPAYLEVFGARGQIYFIKLFCAHFYLVIKKIKRNRASNGISLN